MRTTPPPPPPSSTPTWVDLCAEMHAIEATTTTPDKLDMTAYVTLARLELTDHRRHPLLDPDVRTAYVAAYARASCSSLPFTERLVRLIRDLHELESSADILVDVLAAGRAAALLADARRFIDARAADSHE